MAIGFRTSGMFGKPPMPQQASPQQPMPIGVQQMQQPAKPKFFGEGGVGRAIAGNIGDFLLQQSGMDPIYMPNMLQQRDMAERARMAEQKRMQDREDMQWEWQNKPREAPNNDTINDFNWYKSLPEEERRLYHQMNPVVGYMADGTPRVINPYEAQKPVMQAGAIEDGYRFKGGNPADPNAWEKIGGQPGGASPFVR